MHSQTTPKKIISYLDLFFLFASPIALIGLIVMSIILWDGFNQFNRLLNDLQMGETTTAIVNGSSEKFIFFDYQLPDGTESYGYTRKNYYPNSVIMQLTEGASVQIHYVPPSEWINAANGGEVMVATYDQETTLYYGWLRSGPWQFWLFCWFILVIHPDILYFGFQNPSQPANKKKSS